MRKTEHTVPRGGLTVPLLARPEELSRLRRLTRSHLALWDLGQLTDTAQLCVSELVTNAILHVGEGVPITLHFSLNGARLRIELTDPDPHGIPLRLAASEKAESGRGVALLDAMTAGWGVILHKDTKVTWCELDTDLTHPNGHSGGEHVTRAEALLTLYGHQNRTSGRLTNAVAGETAAKLISDVLHWLRVHGHDPDTVLDHAQTRFEAVTKEVGRWN